MNRTGPGWISVVVMALLAGGCASRSVDVRDRTSPSGGVVVVGGQGGGGGTARTGGGRGNPAARGPRNLKVPPGHYPPRGMCRLWYAGRPPGRQPSPVACSDLRGRVRGTGAFIVYGGNSWDADYDWRIEERRRRGSVPALILDLIGGS